MKFKSQYLKYAVIIILSFVLVLSTVLQDEKNLALAKAKKLLEENEINTGSTPLTEIKFEEKAVLRLAQDSEVIIKKNLNKFPQIEIEFMKGKIWLAKFFKDPVIVVKFKSSSLKFNELDAEEADAGELDAGEADAEGIKTAAPTRGILSAQLSDNAVFIKAIKYPLFLDKKPVFETEEQEDVWVLENKELDREFLENYLRNHQKKIIERGPNFANLSGRKFLAKLANLFTARTAQKLSRNSIRLKRLLEDFEYFSTVDKKNEAQERLNAIEELLRSSPESVEFDLAILAYAREYPELRRLIASEDIKNVLALEALFPLFDPQIDFKNALSTAQADLSNIKNPDVISAQRLILENILNKRKEIYSKEAFELFTQLAKQDEKTYDKNLMMLDLMQKLKDTRSIMENDLISATQAKDAAIFLLSKIRQLRDALAKNDALGALIDADIADMRQFLGFLFSKEIEAEGTFGEKFNAFVEKERELEELRAVAQEPSVIFAKGPKGISVAITERVKNDFEKIGVKDAALLMKEGEVLVENAVFRGANFSGKYDPEKKVFADLKIKDIELGYAVSLANFPRIVTAILGGKQPETSSPATIEIQPQEKPPETKLEKVAKAKVLEKLIGIGILVDEKGITVKNIKEGIFTVETADIKFEFLNNTNEAQNLQVNTAAGILLITEKFPVTSLNERVDLLKKRASFDTEKML